MKEKTDHSNGIVVLTERIPHVRSITLGLWVKRGSCHESEEQNGLSHFIEHMVFKGTTSRSARELAMLMDSIGGSFNAFTAKEYTCFYFQVLDHHLELAVDLTADIIKNPLFDEELFERERHVILEEIKSVEDSPVEYIQKLFPATYWKDQPIGRPIFGTAAKMRSFTVQDLRDYFQQIYVPGNVTVAAAGHLEHESFNQLLEKYFSELNGEGGELESIRPEPTPDFRIEVRPELNQLHICLGGRGLSQDSEQKFALALLNTILGASMSSRLFQRVREDEGLAYTIHSYTNAYQDAGYFTVYTACDQSAGKKVIRLILNEFDKLQKDTVGADELQRAKDHIRGVLLLGLENTFDRMSRLFLHDYYHGGLYDIDWIINQIEKVTLEEITELAELLFQPPDLCCLLLGNIVKDDYERNDLLC